MLENWHDFAFHSALRNSTLCSNTALSKSNRQWVCDKRKKRPNILRNFPSSASPSAAENPAVCDYLSLRHVAVMTSGPWCCSSSERWPYDMCRRTACHKKTVSISTGNSSSQRRGLTLRAQSFTSMLRSWKCSRLRHWGRRGFPRNSLLWVY